MMRQTARPKRVPRIILWKYCAFLAVFLTGAAVYSAHSTSQSDHSPPADIGAQSRDKQTLIPVPTHTVASGVPLSSVNFTLISWPSSTLKGQYVVDVSNWKNARTSAPLPRLLPVPISSVSTKDSNTNPVIDRIPQGMRAITVRLDAESGVEGWARSGSYVDVIVIRASRIASSGFEASVIAENVKILSANRSTETSPSSSSTAQPATATLLVTQQDALAIKTAQNIGKLTFALRGISDTLPTYTQRFSEKTLAGSATQSPMVIRGTAVGPDGQSYVLDNNNRWLKRK